MSLHHMRALGNAECRDALSVGAYSMCSPILVSGMPKACLIALRNHGFREEAFSTTTWEVMSGRACLIVHRMNGKR